MMTKEQRKEALAIGKDIRGRHIKALYKAGYDILEIAETMGTTSSVVSKVLDNLDVI